MSVRSLAVVLISLLFAGLAGTMQAATYWSKATGRWNVLATWDWDGGGSPSSPPGASDDVIITASCSVTVYGAAAAARTVTVQTGVLAIYGSAAPLTIGQGLTVHSRLRSLSYGMLTVSAGGLTNYGACFFTGSSNDASITGGLTNSGSGTITFSSSGGHAIDWLVVNSGTVTFDGSSTTSAVSGSTNIYGGTVDISNTMKFNGPMTVLSPGTLRISSTSGTKTFQDVTVAQGATWNCTVAENVTISGSLSNAGTFTPGAGEYVFSGTNKTISGTFPSFTDMEFSGTYANNTNLTVTGTLDLSSAGARLTNNGTITAAAVTGTAGCILTNAANSAFYVSGAMLSSGTLVADAVPNLVAYTGTAADQTIKAATYHNLTISKSGRTATLGSPGSTVNGTLSVTSGTTLLLSSYNLIINGDFTNVNGAIIGQSSTGDMTVTGAYTNNGIHKAGSSSILTVGGLFTNNNTVERSYSTTNSGIWYFNGGFRNNGTYTHPGSGDLYVTGDFDNYGSYSSLTGCSLAVSGNFTNRAAGVFSNGTSTSSAIWVGGLFSQLQADPAKFDIRYTRLYLAYTGDEPYQLTNAGGPLTVGSLRIIRGALDREVVLGVNVTIQNNVAGALLITSGTLNTNGKTLRVTGTSTSAVIGGAQGRLRINGGTAEMTYLNQSALSSVVIENNANVTITHLHTVTGTTRCDISSGTVRYTRSPSGGIFALRLGNGAPGWHATGGHVYFTGNIIATYHSTFKASGSAVIHFDGAENSSVILADYAGTTSYTSFWDFNDWRVEKAPGCRLTCSTTTSGSPPGPCNGLVTATKLTVNPGATLVLGGNFTSATQGYDINGDIINNGVIEMDGIGGTWTNNNLYVSGNWTGSGTFSPAQKKVTFDGTGDRTVALGGGWLYDLTIAKASAGSVTMAGNLTVQRNLQVVSGTFSVADRHLVLGTGGSAGSVTVNPGAVFAAAGSSQDANAVVTAADVNWPYSFSVSGSIAARNTSFERIGDNGIRVTGSIAPDPDNFNGCTFNYGASGKPMLWVDASLGSDITLTNVSFGNGNPAACNVKKTAAGTGRVLMNGGGGARWGQAYELDPNGPNPAGLIDWSPMGFSLIHPRHDSLDAPVANLVFDWDDAVGGNVKYDLWLGTSNTHPPGTRIAANLTSSQYLLPGPLEGYQDYWWRVRAYNSAGEIWSGSGNYRFQTAAAEKPGPCLLIEPVNNAENQPAEGYLHWHKAVRATSYYVYLDVNDPPQTEPVIRADTFYRYTKSNNTKYYWRVDARNSVGTTPSEVWNFTTKAAKPGEFELSTPGPNAQGVLLTAGLGWQTAAGAASYDVYLDTKTPPDFKAQVQAPATTYVPPDLVQNTDYYWKVVAKNALGETENTGGVRTFRTVLTDRPTLQLPLAGDTTRNRRPTFSWSVVPGPFITYAIELDDDPVFRSPNYQGSGIVTNSWTPGTDLPEGQWHWRVRGDNGAPGPWCESFFDLWVDITPPAKPVLVYPKGNEKVFTSLPRLDWEPVSDARRYVLRIYAGSGGPLLTRTIGQPAGEDRSAYQLVAGEELANQTGYTWSVEALDYAENTAGPSERESFRVELYQYDAGVTQVLVPAAEVGEGTDVQSQVVVRNFGNRPIRPYLRLTISGPLDEKWSVREQVEQEIPPGSDPLIHTFAASWRAAPAGQYQVSCSTELDGDENNGNDKAERGFAVRAGAVRDVGATAILAPRGAAQVQKPVFPVVRVQNFGTETEDFDVRVVITRVTDEEVFNRTERVNGLEKGEIRDYTFQTYAWTPLVSGGYHVAAWTELVADHNRANDSATKRAVLVEDLPRGWMEMKSMPKEPTETRPPQAGAWLAVGPDAASSRLQVTGYRLQVTGYKPSNSGSSGPLNSGSVIYAAKGNKTSDFFKYYPTKDSWAVLSPIPEVEPALGKSKPVGKGSCAVSDGEQYLYMVKGSGTQGFWRYDTQTETWDTLPSTPVKIKGGNDLCYVRRGENEYVYLLAGGKTAFYRYDIGGRIWTALDSVPYGGGKKKYAVGSWLVHDGADGIYAHQAGVINPADSSHHMFRYDLVKGSWDKTTYKGMPWLGTENWAVNKKKKAKDGSAGAHQGGYIYALKGGGSQGFCRYDIAGGSWAESDTVPRNGTGGKKAVKAGADLVNWGSAFFALKGNKTYEMWRYVTTEEYSRQNAGHRGGVQAGEFAVPGLQFSVYPNPIANGFATVRLATVGRNPGQSPAQVSVFDAAGRCVLQHCFTLSLHYSASLDLRKLSAGVYLVRLDAEEFSASQKLVVER